MYFTEIPDRLKYNSKYQAQLSVLHANMIDRISKIYIGTSSQKTKILQALNYISFRLYVDGSIPQDWSVDNPLENIYYIDDSKMKQVLGSTFISPSNIKWNLEPVITSTIVAETSEVSELEKPKTLLKETNISVPDSNSISTISDISLSGPIVPQINVSKIWRKARIDGTTYCIYHSLPEIPTRQCEISLTTDPRILSDFDLLKLFPDKILPVRNPAMYECYNGLKLHPVFGVIFPIEDFTESQIIDNIIRYPNVDDVFRVGTVAGVKKYISFGKYIEIDGNLNLTKNVWNTLKNVQNIPKTKEFMQEYVVRRYILEKEIKHMKHNYDMFGTLDEYLTLFMPVSEYANLGYKNTVNIAKKCVASRISYISSRNPVIRRIEASD